MAYNLLGEVGLEEEENLDAMARQIAEDNAQYVQHDTSRVDKPRYDPAANIFGATDFNEEAIRKQKVMALDAARSQYELDQEYDNERQKLNSLGANVSLMTGSQFRPITPSRSSRGGGSASTEQSVKDIQDNSFLQHFYKTLESAGGKFTDDEIMKFLTATNATPSQVKILMGMKDVINLDGIKQLQKIDDDPNSPNFNGVIYKHVWEYTPADAAEGWKENSSDLTQQRAFAKDKATEELTAKKTALYQRIVELPVYSEDGMMRPQTLEQYNELATALNLTTPEEFGILETHFGHLLKPGDKKTASLVEGNKRIFKRMTDYELDQANKERAREGKPLWISGVGSGAADLNKSALANIVDRVIQAGTTPQGPPGTPLLFSDFGTAFEGIVQAVKADQNVVVEDWVKFQEEVRARFNKAFKDAENTASMEQWVNSGLNPETNPNISGPEATWGSLMAYQDKHGITGEQAKRMSEQWAASPYRKPYDGPDFLYTAWGRPSPPIYTRQDYIDNKEEYPIEDWDKVTYKPSMALSTEGINQDERTWHAIGNNRVYDEKLNGGQGGYKMVPINEYRYTDGYETRVQKEYRAEVKPYVDQWNKGTRDTGLILSALVKETGAMDGVVLKKIEKMLDPTGVVRQSDIEFWAGLSSLKARFEHFVGKVVDPTISKVLPEDLRRQLGAAVKLMHDRLSANSLEDLGYLKERYMQESEEYLTQNGGRLSWNKVIVPSQWSKFNSYKSGEIDGLYNELVAKYEAVETKVTTPTGSNATAQFGAGKPEEEEDD